ncbi:MAG: chloride channel protein, partial [Clostridia bacterium]|nr:chloride channel protein [Clostridia bacterium]
MQALCPLAGMDYALFTFADMDALPLRYLWAAVIVGLAVGFSAAAFTRAYCILRNVIRHTLQSVPFTVKVVSIFAVVSLIGFFSADCIGSGHGLVDEMIEGHGVWYSLILFLLIRAFLLLIATNTDVTGGLFVPMLAFGAILGALCGKAMTAIGILPEEHYTLMVVIGIASFLSAASRTPLMALAFSIEILNGLPNLLPIGIGISIAFLVIETIGITAFTETVVESKTEAANAGRPVQTVHRTLEVMPGSFAVGKEIRDILWPPRFTIVSVHKNPAGSAFFSGTVLVEGDMLYVHYRTCTPDETLKTLEAVVGPQKPE